MNGIESGVDVESVEEDHGYLGFVLIKLTNKIAI